MEARRLPGRRAMSMRSTELYDDTASTAMPVSVLNVLQVESAVFDFC